MRTGEICASSLVGALSVPEITRGGPRAVASATMQIRPFAPSDLPGMYRVCLRTGAAGQDASALYRDPDLLGHVYCGPYPVAEPALSWVVTDDLGVAGYVIGTADTTAFAAWQERAWWPALRQRYPLRDGDDPDAGLVRLLHAGQPGDPAVVDRYPAHLHIDLLPRAQGHGLGRALVTTLTDALRERGVPGLHLGVDPANTGALAFYARIGMVPVPTADGGTVQALDLRGPRPA
jgi:ribosomal protein S18 acetylase RimI-like enzyme